MFTFCENPCNIIGKQIDLRIGGRGQSREIVKYIHIYRNGFVIIVLKGNYLYNIACQFGK